MKGFTRADALASAGQVARDIGAIAALTIPVAPEVFSRRRATAYRGMEQRGHSSGS
jgi:hypothetical protein